MYDRSKLQTIEDFKKLIDASTVTDAPDKKSDLLKNLPDITALDMDSIALLLRLLIQKQFPAFSIGQYGTTESAVDEAVVSECVNNFETPVAGSLVSNAALPRVHAAWVLEG